LDSEVGTNTDPDDPDTPKVITGGLTLYKVDGLDNTGLAGASFKLMKRTGSDFAVDKAAGYVANAETGVELSATSGGSADTLGKFQFEGIAYGNYWLVETAAPHDYRLIGTPIAVTIDEHSYDDSLLLAGAVADTGTTSNDLTVENYKGFQFPLTGGMGTLLFVVIGIVLVGLAGIVIVSSRRKSNQVSE
jgi:LPXTG-motif cell wall-anchored protein